MGAHSVVKMSAAWLLPHCNFMCRWAFASLLGASIVIVLLLVQRLYKRLVCRGSRHLCAPFSHKDVCPGTLSDTPVRMCREGRQIRLVKPTLCMSQGKLVPHSINLVSGWSMKAASSMKVISERGHCLHCTFSHLSTAAEHAAYPTSSHLAVLPAIAALRVFAGRKPHSAHSRNSAVQFDCQQYLPRPKCGPATQMYTRYISCWTEFLYILLHNIIPEASHLGPYGRMQGGADSTRHMLCCQVHGSPPFAVSRHRGHCLQLCMLEKCVGGGLIVLIRS